MHKLIAQLKAKMEVTMIPAFLKKEITAIKKYNQEHPIASCMLSIEDNALLASIGVKP